MKRRNRNWSKYGNEKKIPMHEKEFVIGMLDQIDNEPIRYRLSNLIIWYIDKAKSCKNWYYCLNIITMGANIAIPIVNAVGDACYPLVSTTVLAAVASACLTINSLGHFKDNWTRYRTSAELLKERMSEYLTKKSDCSAHCENAASVSCQECCKKSSDGYHCPLVQELMEQISINVTRETGEWRNSMDREEEKQKA